MTSSWSELSQPDESLTCARSSRPTLVAGCGELRGTAGMEAVNVTPYESSSPPLEGGPLRVNENGLPENWCASDLAVPSSLPSGLSLEYPSRPSPTGRGQWSHRMATTQLENKTYTRLIHTSFLSAKKGEAHGPPEIRLTSFGRAAPQASWLSGLI